MDLIKEMAYAPMRHADFNDLFVVNCDFELCIIMNQTNFNRRINSVCQKAKAINPNCNKSLSTFIDFYQRFIKDLQNHFSKHQNDRFKAEQSYWDKINLKADEVIEIARVINPNDASLIPSLIQSKEAALKIAKHLKLSSWGRKIPRKLISVHQFNEYLKRLKQNAKLPPWKKITEMCEEHGNKFTDPSSLYKHIKQCHQELYVDYQSQIDYPDQKTLKLDEDDSEDLAYI